jgi:hypothetical protein
MPAHAGVIADARKDLGPGVMRDIQYSVWGPSTRDLPARSTETR